MATDPPALTEVRDALSAWTTWMDALGSDPRTLGTTIAQPAAFVAAVTHLRTALAEYDALRARMDERDEEYEVISSEDRTEYSLVTVDTAPDDPRRIGCPRVVRRFYARSWEQATGRYEAAMEVDRADMEVDRADMDHPSEMEPTC